MFEKIKIRFPDSGWMTFAKVSTGTEYPYLIQVDGFETSINLDKTFQNSSITVSFSNSLRQNGTTKGFFSEIMTGDDRYIKGVPLEYYLDDVLVFSGHISEIPESDIDEFVVIADSLSIGLESEINKKITATEYPLAPDSSLGKYGNIIAGSITDSEADYSIGCLLAYRVGTGKYLAAWHWLNSLIAVYEPQTDGTVIDITGSSTLSNDTDDGYAYILYSSDVEYITFNAQGLKFSIGKFDGSADRATATCPFQCQEMFGRIRFRTTKLTAQCLISFVGHLVGNGINLLASGRPAIVCGPNNYKWFDHDLRSYFDGEWINLEFYIAGSGQDDIDNARLWINGEELTAIYQLKKTAGVSTFTNISIGRNLNGYFQGDIDYIWVCSGSQLDEYDRDKWLVRVNFSNGSGTTISDLTGNNNDFTLTTTSAATFWSLCTYISNPVDMFEEFVNLRGYLKKEPSFFMADNSTASTIYTTRGYDTAGYSAIAINDNENWISFFKKFGQNFDCSVYMDETGYIAIKVLNWGVEPALGTIHHALINNFKNKYDMLYVMREIRYPYLFRQNDARFLRTPVLTVTTKWQAIEDILELGYHGNQLSAIDVASRKIFITKSPVITYSFEIDYSFGKSYNIADVWNTTPSQGYHAGELRTIQIMKKQFDPKTDSIRFEAIDITEINGRAIVLYADDDARVHLLQSESSTPELCGVLL